MAGKDKLCENSNPLQGLTFDGTCSTRSRTENGCRSDYETIKMLRPNPATCQLHGLKMP